MSLAWYLHRALFRAVLLTGALVAVVHWGH